MLSIKINIVYIVLMIIFDGIESLVELSNVEDNSINFTDRVILQTVQKLFSAFENQDEKRKPKLQEFLLKHDYFVPSTAKYSGDLNKIADLSRVMDVDKNIQHLIAQVNEVLDENDKSLEVKDYDTHVINYIETFITKLQHLKDQHARQKQHANNEPTFNSLFNNTIYLNLTSLVNNETINEEKRHLNISNDEYWQPSGRRLFKGIWTSIKDFPFMASVQFFKKFQCAGTIIKEDLVITSASCLQLLWNNRFFRENPEFLSVQVGSDFCEHGGESVDVLQIYFHPKFDPSFIQNNLALMRLRLVLNLKGNQGRVKKIDIDRSPHSIPINYEKITAVGWGAKDDNNVIHNVYHNRLSYADLNYYPFSECQELYSRDFVTKKNFCAGFFSKGGGACNHDAGGPALLDGILVGVISFGSPICGAHDSPTVFTKLGFYADWIDDIMTEAPPRNPKNITKFTHFSSLLENKRPKIKFVPFPTTRRPIPIHMIDNLRTEPKDDSEPVSIFDSEEIRELAESETSSSKENEGISIEIVNSVTQLTTQKVLKRILLNNNTTTLGAVQVNDKNRLLLLPSDDENNDVSIENVTEFVKKMSISEKSKLDGTDNEDIAAMIDEIDIDSLFDEVIKRKSKGFISEETIELRKGFTKVPERTTSQKIISDKDEGQVNISAKVLRNISLESPRTSNMDEINRLSEVILLNLVSLTIEEETNKQLALQKDKYKNITSSFP